MANPTSLRKAGLPIVRRTGSAQAVVTQTGVAVTDSTGGSTADTTLAAVGATNSGDVSADINANFAKLAVLANASRADNAAIITLLHEFRTVLINARLIKGSA